jgi:hypothetical protein
MDDAGLPQHRERPAAERSDRWSSFLRQHQCYSLRGANPSDPEFVPRRWHRIGIQNRHGRGSSPVRPDCAQAQADRRCEQ